MSKNFVKIGSNGSNGNGHSSNGNGAAAAVLEVSKKETVAVEEAVAVVVKEEVKEEVKPVEEIKPVVKAEPVITLERKMERVEELNITIDKWKKLQAARKGLNSFRLGSDGLSSTLSLKDADGTPFTTSNPVVVESALAHIKQVLNEKIAEAENEINFNV